MTTRIEAQTTNSGFKKLAGQLLNEHLCSVKCSAERQISTPLLAGRQANPPDRRVRNRYMQFAMKPTVLLTITFFIQSSVIDAQVKDCFNVKYLDFFGLSQMESFRWEEGELDQLVKTSFMENGNSRKSKTYFLIPPIVSQLRVFHPDCNENFDTSRYHKLIQLYFNIRQQDPGLISEKNTSQQLEYIRKDFYDQVLNDTILSFMTFTMDDGPLYGKTPEWTPNLNNGKFIEADFGKLSIVYSNNHVCLFATDKLQNVIWARVMTGSSEKDLKDLAFDTNPIFKTSRAYLISMYSEGEKLTLFINLDGNFMYYYHSW